jgi:hypothetical protein
MEILEHASQEEMKRSILKECVNNNENNNK